MERASTRTVTLRVSRLGAVTTFSAGWVLQSAMVGGRKRSKFTCSFLFCFYLFFIVMMSNAAIAKLEHA